MFDILGNIFICWELSFNFCPIKMKITASSWLTSLGKEAGNGETATFALDGPSTHHTLYLNKVKTTIYQGLCVRLFPS